MANTKSRAQKKYFIFGSFILCCLGASLLASAMATLNWFEATCHTDQTTSTGSIHFGLFEGKRTLKDGSTATHNLRVVCDAGDCMYSCGLSKELRVDQLRLIRNNEYYTSWAVNNCTLLLLAKSRSPASLGTLWAKEEEEEEARAKAEVWAPEETRAKEEQEVEGERESSTDIAPTTEDSKDDTATPGSGQAEFMDYGLWAGTIACLCLGMLFAVVGALFAVINTATTPVEAITGVPGLYVWNTLAALFNLVCVICWAVQFHAHLTRNVLLYDKDNGWTTEGNEVFGYSYWLVVVAIFVHVANILIIFFGTYEPKVKEQMKAPESKSGTIMLY
ncbi:uncharacterized protein LOC125028827 [Penaeus chinensis]|uniref:uncharacterized protein LOC125028827 n=1 Tax=Penaeus chinensis TaxID=139456 RepID=UPI001FB71A92|nr:uncharacterized protein LOC125028827 [Penaeus chinensis]